jgi:hypothetical protein
MENGKWKMKNGKMKNGKKENGRWKEAEWARAPERYGHLSFNVPLFH